MRGATCKRLFLKKQTCVIYFMIHFLPAFSKLLSWCKQIDNWKLLGVKINLNLISQTRGIKLPCSFCFSLLFNGLSKYSGPLCVLVVNFYDF